MSKILQECTGIYFIQLGKFSDIKQCFKFPEGYDFSCFSKDPIVYKFGKTTNIASRVKDHVSNFKKCNINLNKDSLKAFIPIENENLKMVEEKLLKMFSDMYRNFPFTGIDDTRRKELIFLNDDEFIKVQEQCKNIVEDLKEPVKEIRKVELIDTLEDIRKYYGNYEKMVAFENSIEPLKDIDLRDYSKYCYELDEVRQYLFRKDITIVMYIEPKNQPRNFYKDVRLVKIDKSTDVPVISDNEFLAICKVSGEEYYILIPRFPC